MSAHETSGQPLEPTMEEGVAASLPSPMGQQLEELRTGSNVPSHILGGFRELARCAERPSEQAAVLLALGYLSVADRIGRGKLDTNTPRSILEDANTLTGGQLAGLLSETPKSAGASRRRETVESPESPATQRSIALVKRMTGLEDVPEDLSQGQVWLFLQQAYLLYRRSLDTRKVIDTDLPRNLRLHTEGWKNEEIGTMLRTGRSVTALSEARNAFVVRLHSRNQTPEKLLGLLNSVLDGTWEGSLYIGDEQKMVTPDATTSIQSLAEVYPKAIIQAHGNPVPPTAEL